MENGNMPQRPMLKKVKRPINRAPQAPISAPADPYSAPVVEQKVEARPVQSQAFEPEQQFQPQTFETDLSFQADFEKSEPSFQPVSIEPEQPQRVAPQAPILDVPEEPKSSPFTSKPSSDAFNLDAYLDDTPQTSSTAAVSQPEPRRFLGEEDLPPLQPIDDDNFDASYDADASVQSSNLPPYLTKGVLIMLGVLVFFVGVIVSKLMFSSETVVRNGLQGVVVNSEVPKGRARCGVAERTQGCILYIMNPQRQEMAARDFYDLAAQLTGRQRFVIETGNMRYSNTKIRPGDIAQFNIPPM